MGEKTEGLKCMVVCRDGWMEEFKCIDHRLQVFFQNRYQFYIQGLGVGFMRELRRCMIGLDGARE